MKKIFNNLRTILNISVGVIFTGCVSIDYSGGEDFERYIEFCRELATSEVEQTESMEAQIAADWMVGASMTTQNFQKEYKIIYADKDYLSFYAKDYSYLGGAHGNTIIRVGTINRVTGEIMKVSDFIPKEKFSQLKAILRDKAIKALGGVENLQAEVEIIENFYLDKEGLHFIYNEYEIACYAAGMIEVVIDDYRRLK